MYASQHKLHKIKVYSATNGKAYIISNTTPYNKLNNAFICCKSKLDHARYQTPQSCLSLQHWIIDWEGVQFLVSMVTEMPNGDSYTSPAGVVNVRNLMFQMALFYICFILYI